MEKSTDKDRLDIDMIYQFLHHEAYWSKGRSLAAVNNSIQHSLCFGGYANGQQIGFARVVSDYTIFAWLMDVFILPTHQGGGAGKQLLQYIFDHPDLRDVKTWGLKTYDAHRLYEQFGFQILAKPEVHMERTNQAST